MLDAQHGVADFCILSQLAES